MKKDNIDDEYEIQSIIYTAFSLLNILLILILIYTYFIEGKEDYLMVLIVSVFLQISIVNLWRDLYKKKINSNNEFNDCGKDI